MKKNIAHESVARKLLLKLGFPEEKLDEILQYDIAFMCPFCQSGAAASSIHGIIHMYPLCQRFIDYHPDVYMRAVRDRITNDKEIAHAYFPPDEIKSSPDRNLNLCLFG